MGLGKRLQLCRVLCHNMVHERAGESNEVNLRISCPQLETGELNYASTAWSSSLRFESCLTAPR